MAETDLQQTEPPGGPTAAVSSVPESRFMIYALGWEGYEAMLRLLGDRHIRVAYHRGNLELMLPSFEHELCRKILARLVDAVTEELDIPSVGVGSTTWRRKDADCGIDPDECYYLFDRAISVLNRTIDLTVDPPPNLALEIDITRGSIDRMAIFAALGIDEVWQFNRGRLRVLRLTPSRTYEECRNSPLFPFLPLALVCRFAQEGVGVNQTPWARRLRQWIRDELAPRYARRDKDKPAS